MYNVDEIDSWITWEISFTNWGHNFLHAEESCQSEEVNVLKEVESEERVSRIQPDVELHPDVRIQVDVIGVDVVLNNMLL